MRYLLIWLLLCGTLSAQPFLPDPSANEEKQIEHFQNLVENRGGQVESGDAWIVGLRGLALEGSPDRLVILRRDPGLIRQFPASLGSAPAGLSLIPPPRLAVPPSSQAEFLHLVGSQPLRTCVIDTTVTLHQRFNRYQRLLLGRKDRLEKGQVRALAVRGHSQVVILGRDEVDNPLLFEYAATLEGPDPPPGQYRLVPQEPGHMWSISTALGPIATMTLDPAFGPGFARAAGKRCTLHFLEDDSLPPGTFTYTLGYSVKGQPLLMYEVGDGPRIALYFATIHGDEAAGTDLLARLKRHFQEHPEALGQWQIRIIPLVNPDSRLRTNAHRVDLNRNFPEQWRLSARDEEYSGPSPLSEPESRCVHAATLGLAPGPGGRPCRIVSLHQHKGVSAGRGLVDGDGPASVAPLLEAMVKAAGPRLTATKIPDSVGRLKIPGSFGTWVSSVGVNVPTVTLELSHADRDGQRNWEMYGKSLIDFLLPP